MEATAIWLRKSSMGGTYFSDASHVRESLLNWRGTCSASVNELEMLAFGHSDAIESPASKADKPRVSSTER